MKRSKNHLPARQHPDGAVVTPDFRQLHGGSEFSPVTDDVTTVMQCRGVSRHHEEQYRAIVEDQTDLICRYLLDGTLIYANDAFCSLFGKSRAEEIGKSLIPRFLEEDREFLKGNGNAHAGEAPYASYDQRAPLPNGELRWIHWSDRAIFDPRGHIAGYQSVGRDITDRKLVEERLRVSEARYRALVELSPDAILVHRNQRIELANAAAVELLGATSAEQLLGKSPLDITPPEYHTVIRGRIEHQVQGKPVPRMEQKIVRLDGTPRDVEVAASPFTDQNGPAIQVILRDITDRKRAEDALRESEERFRSMADTAPVLIWVSGPDKLCTYFNRQWLDFTGRTMEEEAGTGWTKGVHPEDLDHCLATYTKSFDSREPFSIEYRLRRADGTYAWIYDTGIPRISPTGHFLGYVGSGVDITDLRTTLAELQESTARMDLAVESAAAGMWVLNMETNLIWVTERARELYFFSPDEDITLEKVLAVVHPDDREAIREAIERSVRLNEAYFLEHRLVHPDGSIRWVQAQGRVHRSPAGMPIRLMGLSIDITRRKAADEAIRDQLQFETLLADLSARFVKVPTEHVDREIEQALQQVLEFFNGDRCGLIGIHQGTPAAYVTHASYREGIERVSGDIDLAGLFPWTFETMVLRGEHVSFSRLDDLPDECIQDRLAWTAMGVKSSLQIPLFIGSTVRYLFIIQALREECVWPEEYLPRLRLLGEIFVNALAHKQADEELRKSAEENQRLKEKLQMEAEFLRAEVKLSQSHEEIVGQSVAITRVLKLVEQVASASSTVLICGETGTGKELVANAIHALSPRRDKLMVKVNCASLPSSLVESELFGREKGAYTGALTRQIGRFELADGSTIFLDEIAELSLELQAKLLRVLQEGEFERLGSPKTVRVDARVIAATNRNLMEEVRKGNFREDLYYRLNVFPIVVPPLRDRREDIPLLAWAFVKEFGEKMGKKITRIAKRDMLALQGYAWPGNIRELRNIIEHAAIVSNRDNLEVRLPESPRDGAPGFVTLEELENRHISEVLRHTGGRIKGAGGAAHLLGINPSTLYSRMVKLGISPRRDKDEISP